LKVGGTFREHNLTCAANVGFEQMPAMRSTVFPADRSMCVDDRLATQQRDIPDERQKLDLLIKRYRGFVFLALPAQPAQPHRAQSADSLEARGLQLLFFWES
jgi:hypothetical protein